MSYRWDLRISIKGINLIKSVGVNSDLAETR